jgi:hypothetical protein
LGILWNFWAAAKGRKDGIGGTISSRQHEEIKMNKISMDALNRGWAIGAGTRLPQQHHLDAQRSFEDIEREPTFRETTRRHLGFPGIYESLRVTSALAVVGAARSVAMLLALR